MNEIFLYGGVYSWSAEAILTRMAEIGADKDITFRTNSGGGDVFAAQGILADMKKRKGKNIQAMEGNASSMAFFWGLYMDKVTALETTKALVHRADMWLDTDEDSKMLAEVNESFKEAMKVKLDIKAFEKRAGMSLDAFFETGPSNNIRHEIWLSAQDLVDIGLVKEEDVLKLTPELEASLHKGTATFDSYREPAKVTSIESQSITVESQPGSQTTQSVNNLTNNNNNTQSMEATEKEAIILAEKNRVAAWMVWAEVDLAKVQAGITSGKEISAKETQEFVLAMSNIKNLEALKANSAGKVETPKTEPTAEQIAETEYKQAEDALNASLGLKTKEA